MGKNKRFNVGDRVRLTGAFLKSTGQIAGGEGHAVWTVQACPCRLCAEGRFVLTDQPSTEEYTAEEYAREPHLVYRHILAVNLVRVGSVDR